MLLTQNQILSESKNVSVPKVLKSKNLWQCGWCSFPTTTKTIQKYFHILHTDCFKYPIAILLLVWHFGQQFTQFHTVLLLF